MRNIPEPTNSPLDNLRRLIEENGGHSPYNLQLVAEEVRVHKPDFSLERLRNLLNGVPLSRDEIRAISLALGTSDQQFLNTATRSVAEAALQFASFHFKSIVSRQRFVHEFLATGFAVEGDVSSGLKVVSSREEFLAPSVLRPAFTSFLANLQLEDENELFGLGLD